MRTNKSDAGKITKAITVLTVINHKLLTNIYLIQFNCKKYHISLQSVAYLSSCSLLLLFVLNN